MIEVVDTSSKCFKCGKDLPQELSAVERMKACDECCAKVQVQVAEQHAKVRQTILTNLDNLRRDLTAYEQTTHTSLNDGSLHYISCELLTCYIHPSAHNISNLIQSIKRFVKENSVK